MNKIIIWFICGIGSLSAQAQEFITKNGMKINGDNYITQAMTFIPSDTPISKLAISASHDALSYSIKEFMTTTASNTQYLEGTLPVQLHAGIRWFDFRAHYDGTNFIAFHGSTNGGYSLNTDIQYINTFLAANPGEFVVLSLLDGDKTTSNINALTNLLSSSNSIVVTDPNQQPLTYAQVKGRVVITTVADNSLTQCVSPGQMYDPIMPENVGHEVTCIARATATALAPVVMHEIKGEIRIPGDKDYWANYYANGILGNNPLPGMVQSFALAELGAIANAGIPAALYEVADAYKSGSVQIGAVLHDTAIQDYELYQYLWALMYYKYKSSNSTFIDTLSAIGFPHKLLITYDSFCSPFIGGYASDQCYSNHHMNSVMLDGTGKVINSGTFSLANVRDSKIEFLDNNDPGHSVVILPNNRFDKNFGILSNYNYHGKWANYFTFYGDQSISTRSLSQIWSHLSVRAKSPIIDPDIDAMSINDEAYRQTAGAYDGLNGGYVDPNNANTVSALYRVIRP